MLFFKSFIRILYLKSLVLILVFATIASTYNELSQLRYELRRSWATTCTINSLKYKNLKLRKEGE
jgi:hypothetical protein